MGIIKTVVSDKPLDPEDFKQASEKQTTDLDLPSFDDDLSEVDDLIHELEEEDETSDAEDSDGNSGRQFGTDGEDKSTRATGGHSGGSEDAGELQSTGDVAGRDAPANEVDVSVANVSGTGTVAETVEDSAVDMDDESSGASADETVSYEFTPPPIPGELLTDVTSMRHYAVLVSLRTSRWAAKKKDRKAVRDVASANAAKGDIGTFDKNLLAGADGPLKRVNSAIDSARTAYYQQTLPWSMQALNGPGRRQGPRVLPNKYFFKFAKQMADYKKDVQEALDDFVPVYAKLRDQAEINLGKLYNEQEYPHPSEIRSRFSLEFDFSPIPEGKDFSGLADDVVEKLADKLNDSVKTMMQNAMDEAWTRLFTVVQKIHERLSDPNKTFHGTLITNCKDTCENLKYLNVAHDQRMEDLRKRVEKQLTHTDAEAIRENPEIRRRIASDAAAILRDMTT